MINDIIKIISSFIYPKNIDIYSLETDYMDDPRRPGAVLGPKTVPKRTQQLAEMSKEFDIIDEELFWNMHVEIPNSLYGN